MRAVQSQGSLPMSRASTPGNGVRLGAVKEKPRRQANNWQVEEFPSHTTSPPGDVPHQLAPRPSTSGSVSRGGPPSTVARLPVPGSRPISQQTTRPATPYANPLLIGMDSLTLSGTSDPMEGMDPEFMTSLPSITTTGGSPYDENQRLRRELAMLRKRYRQLDFELKKELQVAAHSHTHIHTP